MLQNLISYYPNADAGGGSAPDGAKKEPDRDWKAEAERRDQLLRDTQKKTKELEDRLAKLDADAEAKKKADLEAQGKFKEVNESLMKEKESLAAKIAELEAFRKQVVDSHQAELDELLKGLSDEDKATVELGADLTAKIKLAKRFTSTQTPPNGGPPVVPGRNSQVNDSVEKIMGMRGSTHDKLRAFLDSPIGKRR